MKLVIGFITYGRLTARYLPYFLDSFKKQTFKDFEIIAADNSEERENANREYISKYYPDIRVVWNSKNIGFAKAYNIIISRAIKAGAKYFLAINPDMIIEPGAVALMVKALDNDSKLGSASPKVLRWDFIHNKKTKIIDTCGIQLKPGLRFIDLGQSQADSGQCDKAEILGPSGAAAMYRLSALELVKQGGQYFDELMFMYKEDCDLAYRLYLAGFRSSCASEAIIYHDRTAQARGESNLQIVRNRKYKNRRIKQWSFLGQQIIFIKYWQRQNWQNKLAIVWHEVKIFIFILLFEQYLLKQYQQLIEIRSRIKIYKNYSLKALKNYLL